jgi:hypothetical protein
MVITTAKTRWYQDASEASARKTPARIASRSRPRSSTTRRRYTR